MTQSRLHAAQGTLKKLRRQRTTLYPIFTSLPAGWMNVKQSGCDRYRSIAGERTLGPMHWGTCHQRRYIGLLRLAGED